MTGPIQGRYTLRCGSCQAVAYSSDNGPPTDRDTELVRFADSSCPRGGVNCPNTSMARAAWDELRVPRLQQLVKTLRDRGARTRRLALPAIVANATSPVEITITWATPLPDATYCVFTRTIVPAELVGKIDTGVKLGSITAAGCTLLVAAAADVTAGQARIHVAGVP